MVTLEQFERDFATEDLCKAYLAKLRWPEQIACPRCGGTKVYKIAKPWTWLCKAKAEDHGKSGYRFSVLVGTIFENTNVPLVTWFKVISQMTQSKKGISALQVQRMIGKQQLGKGHKKGSDEGVGSYRTAWYVCQRIRTAMQNDEFAKLTGTVEIDETSVDRSGPLRESDRRRSVSLVATDQASIYDYMYYGANARHESVNHSKGEYLRGAVHTAKPGRLLVAPEARRGRHLPSGVEEIPAALRRRIRLPPQSSE